MKRKVCILLMISVVLFSSLSIAEAMTADKVIENMIVSHEKQMKNIKDITVIMEVSATFPAFVADRVVTYHKRAVIDGKTVYKIRNEIEMMDKKFIAIYDGVYLWQVDSVLRKVKKERMDISPYAILENLRTAQVKYVGTDEVGGRKAYVLHVKDLNKMMGAEGVQRVTIKLWVDAGDYIIVKMEMDMEAEDDKGKKIPVKITVRQKDFRKVNGMLIPYQTVITVPVPGALEVSPEEEQEMRKKLAEMQRQLEQMPPEMRKMMEAMMKPQMEMLQKALGKGEMETITTVKQVRINTGLSDDLFDGRKLR